MRAAAGRGLIALKTLYLQRANTGLQWMHMHMNSSKQPIHTQTNGVDHQDTSQFSRAFSFLLATAPCEEEDRISRQSIHFLPIPPLDG